MKIAWSLVGRGIKTRHARIAAIMIVALLPFSLLAQQRGMLNPGAATPIPFSGPGWPGSRPVRRSGGFLPIDSPPRILAVQRQTRHCCLP